MKNKFLYGFIIISVMVTTALNVAFVKNNDRTDISLTNVEAWGEKEWNDWDEWLTQGFTKDEREMKRPCPSEETSSGGGSITIGKVTIGGGGSHTEINSSDRYEVICGYGDVNCTSIDC